MKSKTEPIHCWDRAIVLKALLFGAVLEAIAIAPAVLSPWGHAGPEWLVAWPSVFVNIPAGLLVGFLKTAAGLDTKESVAAFAVEVYLLQTLIISYIAFVWLRWKKRKAEA
jgi:hypothetical protein